MSAAGAEPGYAAGAGSGRRGACSSRAKGSTSSASPVGVGFAAINTGNNLLYLLLGWLLSFIIASGILSEMTLRSRSSAGRRRACSPASRS